MKHYVYIDPIVHFLCLMQLSLAYAQDFSHEPISDELFMIMTASNTFRENSPVSRERLRVLTVRM